MKVFKPIGSKDRLVEIFQNVNKVKLNEGLYEVSSPNLNAESALDMAFNQLKNNALDIQHSSTQATGEENYVELLATDKQGNNITFVFKIQSTEGDQEGVFSVNSVTLNSFSFDSASGDETIDLAEEGLNRFNQQHAQELVDVVSNYADVEEPAETEVQEAIELIDAIKQQSYPFGGSPKEMQTGSNYADQKPTNNDVRVNAPELDSFIQEDIDEMATLRKVEKVDPNIHKMVLAHLWSGSMDGTTKVAVFVMGTNNETGEKKWIPYKNKPVAFVGPDVLKKPEVAFLEGRAAKEFLAQQGYRVNQQNKMPKPVKEDLNSMIQNLPGPSGAGYLYPQAKELGVSNQYILKDALADAGIELLDIQPSQAKDTFWLIFSIDGKKYKGLINRNYGNAAKVVKGIQIRQAKDSLTPFDRTAVDEIDKPAMKLIQQGPGGSTAGGVKQLEEKMKLPIVGGIGMCVSEVQMVGSPEPLGEPKPINPSTKSPVDDLPPEKRKIIMTAINNLTVKRGRREYAPSAQEINNEILRMRGEVQESGELEDTDDELKRFYKEKELASQHPEQISTIELEPEEGPVPEVSPEKRAIILQAGENLMARNARNPNYSPTINEILDEIDRIEGKKKPMKKVRGVSPEGEYYLTEIGVKSPLEVRPEDMEQIFDRIDPNSNVKQQIIQAADEHADFVLGVKRLQMPPEQYKDFVKRISTVMYMQYLERIRSLNEEEEKGDYPDPIGKKFKPKKHYPKKKKKTDTSVKLNEEDDFIGGPKAANPNGMSFEPKGDEVEQIAQSKEEVGDEIPGGKADGKSPLEYDPDQIAMGLKIEMEHTDDPMKAVEIAMDHLEEFPDYYTRLDKMEKDAKAELGNTEEKPSDDEDKEMTDMLLGYKSHNVGDEIESDEEEIEEPKIDETSVSDEKNRFQSVVNTPRPEVPLTEDLGYSEKDLKDRDPATWHQIQIAKKTLKMPAAMANVMGGMSREEAIEILRSRGIKVPEEGINETFREGQASHFDSLLKEWAKRYGVTYEWKHKDINKFGKKASKSYFVLHLGYEDYRYLADPARLELNKLMNQFRVKFQYPHGTWTPVIA